MPAPVPEPLCKTIETLYRSESGRILATLVRLLGDLDLAEESMHEVFAAALEFWSQTGIPDKPWCWAALISTSAVRPACAGRRPTPNTAAAQIRNILRMVKSSMQATIRTWSLTPFMPMSPFGHAFAIELVTDPSHPSAARATAASRKNSSRSRAGVTKCLGAVMARFVSLHFIRGDQALITTLSRFCHGRAGRRPGALRLRKCVRSGLHRYASKLSHSE